MHPPDTDWRVWIEGVGLLAPGLPDWPQALAVLRGQQPLAAGPSALPAPELLPPAERRRASRIVKATLAAGLQACQQAGRVPASLANVFASSGGDGHNCHALCEQLAGGDTHISPTRFHNSVHNAASGYWSIATGATAAGQVLAAYDASFSAGLLEALTQVVFSGEPVLLVAGDSEYPEPLHAKRPLADTSAVALVLAPAHSPRALAELRLTPRQTLAEGEPDPMPDALAPALGSLPPLRSWPLLAALAAPAGTVHELALAYLPPQVLRMQLRPLASAASEAGA